MYGDGESLSIVTQDSLYITRKNKRKKTPDTSIVRKHPIKEPFNPSKSAKTINLSDVEKGSPKKTPPSFRHKLD